MKKSMIAACTTMVLLLLWAALPAAGEPRAVTLFFTGFVRGNFGPCGCEATPAGGLARRIGYSERYAETSGDYVVQVDLGNYFEPPGPHAAAVNELMARGLERLPVRVMNLTPQDLYFWEEMAARELPTRFVSTNLRPRKASLAAPPTHAIVTIAAAELGIAKDLRIGFLGVSDPRKVKPNSGFRGMDPLEAITEAQRELEGKVDFVVVLADIEQAPGPFREDSVLAEIARAHDDVYAILAAEKRYLLRSPLQVNNAVLLSSVERGRHLGRLTLKLNREGQVVEVRPEFTELDETVPADPEFLGLQQRLEASVPPE